MLDRPKFQIKIKFGRVSRLPVNTGSIQVRWRVADSPRTDTRGRTASREVGQHECIFDEEAEFVYSLGIRTPSQYLRSRNLRFEVMWGPTKRHNKVLLGIVEFDMAQYVGLTPEPHAFLLEDSRINCVLGLEISVEQIKGVTDYKVPEFTAPILKRGLAAGMGIDDRPIQPNMQPNIKTSVKRQLKRPAFLANILFTRQSPYALDPISTIIDLAVGGDGFGDKECPKEVDIGHYDGYLCDEGIRENLISWLLKF